jgi:hypothetical protein
MQLPGPTSHTPVFRHVTDDSQSEPRKKRSRDSSVTESSHVVAGIRKADCAIFTVYAVLCTLYDGHVTPGLQHSILEA